MTNEQLEQRVGETPIAAHEVRELLTRLTEASVESRSVGEVRTIGGLALETGLPIETLVATLGDIRGKPRVKTLSPLMAAVLLAATVGASWWVLQATAPKPPVAQTPLISPQPEVQSDLSGLVPVATMPYGFGRTMNELANPAFEPSVALPKGMSVVASSNSVVWGSGDAQAWVYENRLSAHDEAILRKVLNETIDFALRDAERRQLPVTSVPPGSPASVKPTRQVDLAVRTYYGSSGSRLSVPAQGATPGEVRWAKNRAINEILKSLKWSLGIQAESRRSWGP